MIYQKILLFLEKLINLRAKMRFSFDPNKDLLKKNYYLKGMLKNRRCFILGNAPSLSKQDLSLLENEFVITVNQISRNSQFSGLKTNIHFWADPGFFDEDNVNYEFIEVMRQVKSAENNPIVFYPLSAKSFVKNHNLDTALDVYYFNPMYSFHENYTQDIDFCEGVPGYHTVVDYGIALAIYMEAKEIYLLGCDCTGILNTVSLYQSEIGQEYAYDISDDEKKRMENMQKNNLLEAHFYSWYKVFQQYRFLYKYCTERGIKLVNCTEGGILQDIPREKYEEVIKKKEEK